MKVRQEVEVFASAMEHKLQLNDHKGGWEATDYDTLFRRLRDEVDELEKAISEVTTWLFCSRPPTSPTTP